MNLSYRPLLFFLAFSISLSSFSQLNSGNLTQFTENDGLPGAQVNKLLIDKFGYVWVGTINGLARYDGYEFKRFYSNPNDTTSIQGLIVWSLFEDHKGEVWVGSSPSFLNAYNPNLKKFRQYDFAHLINHAANVELIPATMCEDNNGRIYFGIDTYLSEKISSALLYKDEKDDKIKRFIAPDSLVIQNVISMAKDNDGNIWLLSYSGLFKIDTARKITRFDQLQKEFERNEESAADIKIDKSGHIWMITRTARLYEFNPGTGTYKTWLFDKLTSAVKNNLSRTVIELDSSGKQASDLHSFNRLQLQQKREAIFVC